VSSKRQNRVSKGKSLAELFASGGLRPDRHWELILEGSQPDGVPDHEWREAVAQAKAHLRKRTGEERRRAEALLAATALTPEEIAAYEQLLSEIPNPDGVNDPLIEGLRHRPDFEKKMHVRMGMLNPLDVLKAEELAGVEPGPAPEGFQIRASRSGLRHRRLRS
jgi:hypothetical protein